MALQIAQHIVHVDIDAAVYFDAHGRRLGEYAVGEVELVRAREGVSANAALAEVLACKYRRVSKFWIHPNKYYVFCDLSACTTH